MPKAENDYVDISYKGSAPSGIGAMTPEKFQKMSPEDQKDWLKRAVGEAPGGVSHYQPVRTKAFAPVASEASSDPNSPRNILSKAAAGNPDSPRNILARGARGGGGGAYNPSAGRPIGGAPSTPLTVPSAGETARAVAGTAKNFALQAPEGLPFIGSAISAYRHGLTPFQKSRLTDEYEYSPGLLQMLRSKRMDRKQAEELVTDLDKHPISRALQAARIDAPIDLALLLSTGVIGKWFAKGIFATAQRLAVESVAQTSADEATSIAAKAGAKAVLAGRVASAGTLFAYGVAGKGKEDLEREHNMSPMSEYAKSGIYTMLLGMGMQALGAVTLKPLFEQMLKLSPRWAQALKADPAFREMGIKPANDLSNYVAADFGKGMTKGQAGDMVLRTMQGLGSEEDRSFVASSIMRHPDVLNSQLGQHILRIVRAAQGPQMYATDSPDITVRYEDKYRNEKDVVLKSPAEAKAFAKRVNANEVRIVSVSGQPGKTAILTGPIESQKVLLAPFSRIPSQEDLMKLMQDPTGLEKYFQGLPITKMVVQGEPIGLPSPPARRLAYYDWLERGQAEPPPPLGPLATRGAQGTVGTPAIYAEAPKDLPALGPAPGEHPAEKFAQETQKTIAEADMFKTQLKPGAAHVPLEETTGSVLTKKAMPEEDHREAMKVIEKVRKGTLSPDMGLVMIQSRTHLDKNQAYALFQQEARGAAHKDIMGMLGELHKAAPEAKKLTPAQEIARSAVSDEEKLQEIKKKYQEQGFVEKPAAPPATTKQAEQVKQAPVMVKAETPEGTPVAVITPTEPIHILTKVDDQGRPAVPKVFSAQQKATSVDFGKLGQFLSMKTGRKAQAFSTPQNRVAFEVMVQKILSTDPTDPYYDAFRARVAVAAMAEMVDRYEVAGELAGPKAQTLLEKIREFDQHWLDKYPEFAPRPRAEIEAEAQARVTKTGGTQAEPAGGEMPGVTLALPRAGIQGRMAVPAYEPPVNIDPKYKPQVRGWFRDPDGTRLPVMDNGDGTGTVMSSFGRVIVPLKGKIAEAVKEITTSEVVDAQSKGSALLIHQPLKKLEKLSTMLSKKLASEVNPGIRSKLLQQHEEVLAAIQQRLGKKPPKFGNGGSTDLGMGFGPWKDRPLGPYGQILPNDRGLGGITNLLGFGDAYYDPQTKEYIVLAPQVAGGKYVPLRFPSEPEAVAAVYRAMNRRLQITRHENNVNRFLETGELPPHVQPSNFIRPWIKFNSLLSNEPFAKQPRLSGENEINPLAMNRTNLRSMGPGGRQLEFLLQNYIDFKSYLWGTWESMRQKFVEEAGAKQHGAGILKAPVFSIRKIESGEDLPALEAHRKYIAPLAREVYDVAGELGHELAEPIEEKDYVPHMLEFSKLAQQMNAHIPQEFIESMIRDGMAKDQQEAIELLLNTEFLQSQTNQERAELATRMVNRIKERTGREITLTQALQILEGYGAKGLTFHKNLAIQRRGDTGYMDDYVKAFDIYFRRAFNAVAERHIFGANLEHLNNALDLIDNHTMGSRDALREADEVVAMVRGTNRYYPAMGPMGSLMEMAYNADRAFLGFSGLYHMTQGINVAGRFGYIKALEGMRDTFTDILMKEGPEVLNQFVGAAERSFNEDPYYANIDQSVEHGALDPDIAKRIKATHAWGNFMSTPLRVTIGFMRNFTFHVGRSWFDTRLEKLGKNPKDAKALADIQELFGRKATVEQILSMPPEQMKIARNEAGRKAANAFIYEFTPLTLPNFTRGPFGRFVGQFKSFMYQLTAGQMHEMFGRYGTTDSGEAFSPRRLRAWANFLLVHPIAGTAIAGLLTWLGAGTRQSARGLKAFKDLMRNPSAYRYVNWAIQNLAVTHAVGFFTSMTELLFTHNYEAMKVLDFVSPAMSWALNLVLSGSYAGASLGNYVSGHRAMARYDAQRAVEIIGQEAGGPGRMMAKYALPALGPTTKEGRPRRPGA